MKLYTADEAAKIVGKDGSTVRMLARTHGIGQKMGRDWVLTDEDLDKLRAIPQAGRPKGAKNKAKE